jgi:hypothetical protein
VNGTLSCIQSEATTSFLLPLLPILNIFPRENFREAEFADEELESVLALTDLVVRL